METLLTTVLGAQKVYDGCETSRPRKGDVSYRQR
jgi:hypothetical protein